MYRVDYFSVEQNTWVIIDFCESKKECKEYITKLLSEGKPVRVIKNGDILYQRGSVFEIGEDL